MAAASPLSPGAPLLIATPPDWREACLSMPAMRAFQRLSEGRVRVLCPDTQLGFWSTSGFGGGIAYPARAGARDIAGRLGKENLVLLWEDGPAAEGCVKAKVARRIGPATDGLRKRLTEAVELNSKPGPIKHRVQFYLETAAALGADAFLPENFAPLESDTPRSETLLLAPDSSDGAHYQWPVDRWVELAKALQEQGRDLAVAALGTAGRELASRLEGVAVQELAFPALEALAVHRICIAADGALPHLASHAGVTCVALFGPGEPEWLRPLGRHHAVVRRKAECSPCFASRCVMDLRCQLDLTVEDVLKAVESLALAPAAVS